MTRHDIPDTIERTTELPHPVERVWAALTDPQQFGSWFADDAAWELREGAPMEIRWHEHGLAPGLIVTVEPMSRFAFRWGADGEPLDPELSTLVEWTLGGAADGGTTLTLVESGFRTLHNGPDQIVDNTTGWREQFDALSAHLAGG